MKLRLHYSIILLFTFFTSFSQVHTINTVGSTFYPSILTINVGDTVTWNNTGGYHNVNATQSTFPNNPEGFGNSVGSGWTFQWIFTLAGTYDYQLSFQISEKIQNDMTYPGQVKVTVIRETRAISYAK